MAEPGAWMENFSSESLAEAMPELYQQQWTFSEETLARARQMAHSSAVQTLRGAASEGLVSLEERRPRLSGGSSGGAGAAGAAAAAGAAYPAGAGAGKSAGKDREQRGHPPRASAGGTFPAPEQCRRLALFYAQKVPELCGLCGAPSEVKWTAVVFYQRFFAMRSPLEFDPMPVMFAAVHLACTTEEVHEITLDKLLADADFGSDEGLRSKVAALELPLLEGIGFTLTVEPKPDSALRVLAEELHQLLHEQLGGSAASGPGARASASGAQATGSSGGGPSAEQSPPMASRGAAAAAAAAGLLEESVRGDVLREAEDLVLQLAVRTDAILRFPPSILLAAALGASLDAASARRRGGAAPEERAAPSNAVTVLLDANLAGEPQRAALRRLLEEVNAFIQGPALEEEEVRQAAVKETAKAARRCQRAFDKLREESSERHEAHRRERKRRYSQMSFRGGAMRRGVGAIPTPVHHALAMKPAALFGDDDVSFQQLGSTSLLGGTAPEASQGTAQPGADAARAGGNGL